MVPQSLVVLLVLWSSSPQWMRGPRSGLGPYVLLEPIGAGGMGEVWKAHDTRLDRTVAIKRLKPEHSASFGSTRRAPSPR